MSNFIVAIDLILLLLGFYFIIFNPAIWATLLGLVFTASSFIIPEQYADDLEKSKKTKMYELAFLIIWFVAYFILTLVWEDAHLAKPYFNMVLFVYFAYRLIRIIRSTDFFK